MTKEKNYSHCIMSEMLPDEVPMRISNAGTFYLYKNINRPTPPFINSIFNDNNLQRITIPYEICIPKGANSFRRLQLIHPCSSQRIVNLFSSNETAIVSLCSKSTFSIRAPRIRNGKGFGNFFTYKKYNYLPSFWDSNDMLRLEGQYSYMRHLDISNCFPSIYTHTISWAIKGKSEAKRIIASHEDDKKTLHNLFDKLMQSINYNETNGIVVGPELSRIFAEIILQEIDIKVEKNLSVLQLEYNKHYVCCRYIDDYFIFYNDEKIADLFEKELNENLSIFKLALNTAKKETYQRPFINKIGKAKNKTKQLFKAIKADILNSDNTSAKDYISQLRDIASDLPNDYNALSPCILNFIQQTLNLFYQENNQNLLEDDNDEIDLGNILESNNEIDEDKSTTHIINLLDVAFYWLSIDIRYSTTCKVSKIVYSVLDQIENFDRVNKTLIKDKLHCLISQTISTALNRDCIHELLNLLTLEKDLGPNYTLSEDLISNIYKHSFRIHANDAFEEKRTSYFEIVSLLFYIGNNAKYTNIKANLIFNAQEIFKTHDPKLYAESAYLFFDLLKCPYIDRNNKELILKTLDANLNTNEISRIINYTGKRNWFFDWNTKHKTKDLLKNKKKMLHY